MRFIKYLLAAVFSIALLPGIAFAFDDVPRSGWYSDAANYMSEHGIITGYSGTNSFGANDVMTRAQFVTVLWRYDDPTGAADTNTATTVNETGLPDVPNGQYYTAAANWAVKNGVVSGVQTSSGARFDSNGALNFEQMITMLAREIGGDAVNSADVSILNNYSDGAAVASWARPAMAWAVQQGYVAGSNGALYPAANVTRARAAVVLYRIITGNTVYGDQNVPLYFENRLFSVALPPSYADKNITVEEFTGHDTGGGLYMGPGMDFYSNGKFLVGVCAYSNNFGPQGWFEFKKLGHPAKNPNLYICVLTDVEADNPNSVQEGKRLVEEFSQYVTVFGED